MKNYIDKIREEFIEKHVKQQETEELIFINNVESSNIKDYHGREILELLQNADDAYQKCLKSDNPPKDELNVSIIYKNGVLSISNTGTFFDRDGIIAIIQSHNSPKRGKYIGNKGTGFRSILNWAEKVRIFSGEYNLEFSKDIAKDVFERIKNSEQVKKQLDKSPNLYVPMLSVPNYIARDSKYPQDATTIEITVNPQKNNDDFSVEKQLAEMDYRILLFLPNISTITVETDENTTVYTREKKIINNASGTLDGEISKIRLVKTLSNDVEKSEDYTLFDRCVVDAIEDNGNKNNVCSIIAIPNENREVFAPLYTYFPIANSKTPFNCIMHATYVLSGNRDSINRSETNKKIAEIQLTHLIDVVKYYIEQKEFDKAFHVITPTNASRFNWSFGLGFSSFNLEDEFIKRVKDLAFLPTVNGEGISFKDSPKRIDGDFPQVFKGDGFGCLLKPIQNEKSVAFLQMLSDKFYVQLKYNERELCESINSESKNWSVEDRVSVFAWWSERYENYLPNLLKNQNGDWVIKGESCFFLDGNFSDFNLPQWVTTPALKEEDQKALFEEARKNERVKNIIANVKEETGRKQPISRIISTNVIYPLVGFEYRDRNSIISAVNTCVTTYENALDFVKWLWQNYRNESPDWMPPKRKEYPYQKYNFPAPTKNSIISGDNLYFGEEYGNELAEKLFVGDVDKFPLVELSDNKEEIMRFFSKFGVKTFPSIAFQEILNPNKEYLEGIKRKLRNVYNYSYVYTQKYKWVTILGFEKILENLTTGEIIRWIAKDGNLKNHLKTRTENKVSFEYKGPSYRKYWERTENNEFENYLLFVLNRTKWVEIEGEKYSPREILLEKAGGAVNSKFIGYIPYIGLSYIGEISRTFDISEDEIREVFALLDFCNSVLELSSNDFYGLLLTLQNSPSSKAVDLYRTTYRAVEQLGDKKLDFSDSYNKRKFFEEGKVLVKLNKESCFYLAKDSFLPSTKIILKNNLPIVEKATRTGKNENFINIFNVREYNKTFEIVERSIRESHLNDSFQAYFKEFKKYAKAYKTTVDNIAKHFDKISIKLVSDISVVENGEERRVSERYVLLSKSLTTFYITAPNDGFDVRRISEYIEDIFSNLANTAGFDAGKIGELFRASSEDDRRFLIQKEFCSLSILEDDGLSKAMENNFKETILKIKQDYDFDGIELEEFSSNETVEKIIKVLKDIGVKTIRELNENGFEYPLSFNDYYTEKFDDFIQKEDKNYENFLYNNAISNEEKQNSFYDDLRKFRHYGFLNRAEDRDIDVIDVEEHFYKTFGDWRGVWQDKDAEKEYSSNYAEMNPQNEFEDLICNDDKVRIMIYFKREEEFSKWKQSVQKERQKEAVALEDPYAELRKIIPTKEDVCYADGEISFSVSGTEYGNARSFNSSSEAVRQKHKKILGNKGELLIYNYLVALYGKDNVQGVSESFVSLKLLYAGQGDSTKGYDIKYTDGEGKDHFVEVKTGKPNSFTISPKELEFAKKNADKYELYLVYGIEDKSHKFVQLPNRFWKDEKYKMQEIVEKIEVKF